MLLGEQIHKRLEELSTFSSSKLGVTRLPFTEEHAGASLYLRRYMEEVGLQVCVDAVGNVIGRYIYSASAKILALGSHQDTVKQGGKYDGALGIVLSIAAVGELIKSQKLTCNILIIAFADEEGVRFHTGYLASAAFNGRGDVSLLERRDEAGMSLAQALQNFGLCPQQAMQMQPSPMDAYVEVHIEQGPVLDAAQVPVGIVTAIQSLALYEVTVQGMAAHAGTVPMALRKDPVLTASAAITALLQQVAQEKDVVATVGCMHVYPGAVNVIAEKVVFSIDIRCPYEEKIQAIMEKFTQSITSLCQKNTTSFTIQQKHNEPATLCDADLQAQWECALRRLDVPVFYLASGAGHDAQEMAHVCPVAMLFVRCKDGISHNAQESVHVEDMHTAACVLMDFIQHYV